MVSCDYLKNREQRFVIDGKSSTWGIIPSGVLQGSILGPLFFVIFISDFSDVVLSGNTVLLYADDCKTSRLHDRTEFQGELDNLYVWSQGNKMAFNVKKRKLMHIAIQP